MLTTEDKIHRLNKIGIALTSTTNLQQLLELIVSESRSFTGADGGSLFTVEDDKLIFRVAQTESLEKRDYYYPPFKAFPLPLDKKSVAGYVALTGKLINVDDCYALDPADGPVVNKSFDRIMKYRSKSMLTVPMQINGDEVIGVLQLINAMDANKNIISFSTESQELMLSIASQAAVAVRNAKLISDIKDILSAYVKYSAIAIDARSPHTAGHSRRVAGMTMRIAQAINEETEGDFSNVKFNDAELEELWFASWLHDIGKIGVRESVLEKTTKVSEDSIQNICCRMQLQVMENEMEKLSKKDITDPHFQKENEEIRDKIRSDLKFLININKSNYLDDESYERLCLIASRTYTDLDGKEKPILTENEFKNLSIRKGNLASDEWMEMRSHVSKTMTIIKNIPFTREMANVSAIASTHHEMLDGSGYPKNLEAKDIMLQARILAVADVFDALVATDRPYKQALPLDEALNIMRRDSERGLLDKRLVDLIVKKNLFKGHKEDQAEYPWTGKSY